MKKNRIENEKEALRKMFYIYCKGQNHGDLLCDDCEKLLNYSLERLDLCKYANDKPFCSKCRVNCYKPEMRSEIRKVMRYSGLRLIWHHPVMALKHLFNK